jgi:hypothetical protein
MPQPAWKKFSLVQIILGKNTNFRRFKNGLF